MTWQTSDFNDYHHCLVKEDSDDEADDLEAGPSNQVSDAREPSASPRGSSRLEPTSLHITEAEQTGVKVVRNDERARGK